MTVVIPTLTADETLSACVASLGDCDIIVIDNSGRGLARKRLHASPRLRIIDNRQNVGFGSAINQGIAVSSTPYVAALNDDAIVQPQWLTALVEAAETDPCVGMCAAQVRMLGTGKLDSAGMLICADGSSRQRGHGELSSTFDRAEEVLLPSGSAALYRRTMIDEIGGFDDDFFLYCEDTDLGLRARWAGWKCLYVPQAIVEHHYSRSAGRASALKAYYVERNRLFLLVKNYPVSQLLKAPLATAARYFWHLRGYGAAGEFQGSKFDLIRIVLRAHFATLRQLRTLLRKRRAIPRKISASSFVNLLRHHSISPRQVASL